MGEHIGYKVCKHGDEFVIVELEITGDNNEDRKNVFDMCYAKMRCSEAKVIRICNEEGVCYKFAVSLYDDSFIYRVNETIEIKDYNTNINEVCATGIHYYLTKKAAMEMFKLRNRRNVSGELNEYYSNGRLRCRYYLVDGEAHGRFISWYRNGQIDRECTYIGKKIYGTLKKYYKNGNLKEYCKCDENATVNGDYKSWYFNGQKKVSATYLHGNRNGVFRSWYENGQIKQFGIYNNGVLDGIYDSWYENGQMKDSGIFKNGVHDGIFRSWHENGFIKENKIR